MPQPTALLTALGAAPTTWESTLTGMAASIYAAGILYGSFVAGPLMAPPAGMPTAPDEAWESTAQCHDRILKDKKYCYTMAKGIIDELIINGETEPGTTGILPTIPSINDRIALWQGTDGYHLQIGALGLADLALVGHNHASLYSVLAHDHASLYSPLAHLHAGVYAAYSHTHTALYAPLTHYHTGVYALAAHLHTGVYEPVFAKRTAFNKNFGVSLNTVAQGNHTHPGILSSIETFTIDAAASTDIDSKVTENFYSGRYMVYLSVVALSAYRSFDLNVLNQGGAFPFTISNIIGDFIDFTLGVEEVAGSMTISITNNTATALTCKIRRDGIYD